MSDYENDYEMSSVEQEDNDVENEVEAPSENDEEMLQGPVIGESEDDMLPQTLTDYSHFERRTAASVVAALRDNINLFAETFRPEDMAHNYRQLGMTTESYTDLQSNYTATATELGISSF